MRTLGQKPTLAEILEYYDREDVRSFIYQACLERKICMFFAAEMRWAGSWRRNFLRLESPNNEPQQVLTSIYAHIGELLAQ